MQYRHGAERIRSLAVVLLLAAVYFGSGWLGLRLAIPPGLATPIWIPSGIAVAALLLWGQRVWPGIWLGSFSVNLGTLLAVSSPRALMVSLAVVASVATGSTLQALLAAWLTRRLAGSSRPFDRVRDVLVFVATAVLSCVVAASVGTTSLALGGFTPWTDYGITWLTWWLGDVVGILVIVPLLLTWLAPSIRWRRRYLVDGGLFLLCLLIAGMIVFGNLLPIEEVHRPFAFILVPFFVWAAIRFGQRAVVLTAVVISAMAIGGTVQGMGPFATGQLNESMLHLQTFLGVMVAAGLILAAAFAERRHAEERLRLVVESAPNAMLMAASDGRIVLVNAQAEKLFGYQREELIGQAVEMLLPEQYRARHPGYRGGFAADPQARPMGAGRDLHGRRKDGGEVPIEIGLNPIKTAEGLLILASIVDITERKRIEAAQAKLAAIVESSDDAIIGMTIEGIVETWNCGAERIFGYAAEEIVGKSISILIPEERASEEKEILDRLRRGNRLENFETVRIAKDGRRLDVSLTISPIKGSTGRIIGASKIARDISPRKRAEKELLRAKADAEEANSAKDRFLAVLSHELRTPLTPVLMGVSTLQEVRELAPDVREILEMVRRNVELETRLIDDLLDVTRIARGKVELTRSPAPLRTIIQRAIEVCMPDMEAGGLHFGVDLGTAEACWVMADAPRLQQVFWNLLKNAIKFTRHGGCVGVRCRRDRSHVVAEVNDSGIGIDPEALPRVFDAFEQSERSITRQFGGMGLGLTICKALVEMHGGTIEAHSEGRGKGTTFRVRLPLSAPAGQPDAPDASAPRERDVCPLRILLVEDHEIAAKMIGMALTLEGHELETAGNVAMALELADRRAFDLLISDIGLPDGSGLDLMRQLRQRGHNLPGIALSGYGQEEDIQRSQEAGFATHIIKPAARKRLIEAIASVTAGHGATDG